MLFPFSSSLSPPKRPIAECTFCQLETSPPSSVPSAWHESCTTKQQLPRLSRRQRRLLAAANTPQSKRLARTHASKVEWLRWTRLGYGGWRATRLRLIRKRVQRGTQTNALSTYNSTLSSAAMKDSDFFYNLPM